MDKNNPNSPQTTETAKASETAVTQELKDVQGNTHQLTAEIATDGQGKLHATKNPDIIIRIVNIENSLKFNKNPAIMPYLANVAGLALPLDNLETSMENPGYTIKIPNEFVPLTKLEGTLKRRLTILAELSKILIKLHSLPIIYGSMSPSRVFVSPNPKNTEVCLLHSAKMDFCMDFTEETDQDEYISPEAAAGKGATIASDSYAFAKLAADLLKDFAITPTLQDFLTSALHDEPTKRPKMLAFYLAFMQEFDLLITCGKCHINFHYEIKKCPGCQATPPTMIKAFIYDKIGESEVPRGQKILEFANTRQTFWNYHTNIVMLDDEIKAGIDCTLNISADRKLRLIFKNLMDKEIQINNNAVAPGAASMVALPCELIRLTFKLYAITERYIDMVVV